MATPEPVAASVTSRTNPSYSSTPARPYCAHRCEGSALPSGPDEDELHLVADQRVDAGCGQPLLDPAQRAAAAVRVRRAVLIEESAWGPGQSVAEDAQRAQIDADPLVPHHAGGVAEDDAGLVDGEDVPDRAGAESRVGERAHPAQRDGLGVGEPGGVDDGADQRGDPVGLELGDGRGGEGFGCHVQHIVPRVRRELQRDLAGLADVERAQHPAHAQPHRARQRQVGQQFVAELLAAARPEVLVVAQAGVVAGEAFGELRGDALLRRCSPARSATRAAWS